MDTSSSANSDEASLVEKAFEAIRRVSSNASAYKLDLKNVFQQFDTSGDGRLSINEMADAFLALGVKLDIDTMTALWR